MCIEAAPAGIPCGPIRTDVLAFQTGHEESMVLGAALFSFHDERLVVALERLGACDG